MHGLSSHYKTLRLILGDQLNSSHSWFREKSDTTLYVIAELHQEQTYCRHHIQKVLAFFCAMENFAVALSEAGHHCLHLTLDDTDAYKTLPELITALIGHFKVAHFEYQQPDERRLVQQLDCYCAESSFTSDVASTQHFYVEDTTAAEWQLNSGGTMEHFYRKMRKRFNVLVHPDGKPIGDKWNFDHDNRNSLSADDIDQIPKPKLFRNDIEQPLARIRNHKLDVFGEVGNTLSWPTNRKQARALMDYFCEHLLPRFGQFQDAMTDQKPALQWSLYHSRISFALNAKIISPKEVINKAIAAYDADKKSIPLASLEGFVRQIIGWREYVRLVYWQNNDYGDHNYLRAQRSLPEYFWTGNTKMNCLKQAIGQSLEYAYAHHIQRLMVTGNFCLLAGIHPQEVDDWYLGIYVDAIEWVEQPNTRGMSQFADGGIMATKPYAASGNYIHKMSDYCKNCHYKVKQKDSDDACPLNSLYWHFLDRHKKTLGENQRMQLMYKQWHRKTEGEQKALMKRAEQVLQNIESL
ncbi:cryptochrome/photolyase family protein [Halioxenophilus aromaticivorans]